MCKRLGKFTCLFLALLLFITPVLAIDCEYEEANLTVSYDENSKVTINSDFVKSDYAWNLIVAKWSGSQYTTDEIKIDQTLYKKYQGYSCPTNMYVCEYSHWSLDLPSLYTLGLDLSVFLTALPCLFGHDWSCQAGNTAVEDGWALLTLNEKELHILTEEEYEDSYIRYYNGGVFSTEVADHADVGYDFCGGNNDGWGWTAWGSVCGLVTGVVGTIGDTLFSDGVEIAYYKNTTCYNVQYSGEYNKFDINCSFMTSALFEYQELVKEYKGCSSELCKTNVLSKMQQSEKNLNSRCDYVLQNYEYSDSRKDCIKQCLNLDITLNEFKEGTDLYNYRLPDATPNACNFSSRLVAWIMKVVEWVRYIIPILLILLSIMEFIKAVSSDEEDAIRKTGGRFVKRLIVAALIFILPLLLEFLLGIFNIPINDYCLK